MTEFVYILIKDYGCEGQKVFGATCEARIAEIWALGDFCYFIHAEVEGNVTNDPLPAIQYS